MWQDGNYSLIKVWKLNDYSLIKVYKMKRFIYDELKKWKQSEARKPLIMYGARQVGKTYIIKEFGEQEYDSLVYVNCYKNELA